MRLPEPAGAASPGDRAVEALAFPLDVARAALLEWLARLFPAPIRRRDLRVAIGGTVGVVLSLTLAVVAPLWLLTVGPLLLGVPHLLSDVRYLVVRPALHRRPGFVPLFALPLAASFVWPGLSTALVAAAGAMALARVSLALRGAVVALLLALAAAARAGGYPVDVLFGQAHNAVALALWWCWPRARRPRWQLWPVASAAAGFALLLFAGDALVHRVGSLAPPRPGLEVETLALSLSPVADPAWSLRLVLAFAFAQSVHYGAWLRLIPDDARPRPGLRSFASSYRALAAECGRPLVIGTLLLTVAFCLLGLHDAAVARANYLRVALFHGPLELSAIALLLVERRGPGEAAPATA